MKIWLLQIIIIIIKRSNLQIEKLKIKKIIQSLIGRTLLMTFPK